MPSSAEIKKLVQTVRTEGCRLELDQLVFHTPSEGNTSVALPAAIEVVEGELYFDLRIPSGTQFPASLEPLIGIERNGPQIVTAADCYRITARTADGVAVELENVHPSPSVTTSATHFRRCRIGFSRLGLPAEGIDAMDATQIRAMLDALTVPNSPTSAPAQTGEAVMNVPEEDLFARVPHVDLRILNNGTETTVGHPFLGNLSSSKANCFIGQVDGGEFCLHKDEAGDLCVYYRRPIGLVGARYTTSHVFNGILTAIGYTHGCHPWACYHEHRSHYRVIERWIKSRDDCQRHGLCPMDNGRLSHSPDAQRLFIAAAEFFAADSATAQRHSRAQWLLREANPRHLAKEIQLMTLSILFEGLLRDLEVRYLTPAEREHPERGGLVRREKWRQALERYGLPWTDAFERVYESWDFYRSPLAHGFQQRTNDNAGTMFNAYSRLTAAIHILLAREAGYVGPVAKSILESDEMVVIR
jgi:hypothetical protein